jgi:LSD1 subclass zinc finger protein
MVMKRWLLAFIAVSLTAVGALVLAFPAEMLAPGPLIAGHAAVPGLSDDCLACHAPLKGAAEVRCTTCHTVPGIGLRTVAGRPIPQATAMPPFHQGLVSTDCMGCHTDHPLASLVPAHSHSFDHAMLTPAVGANCAGCHVPPKDALHPDAKAVCSTCHSQTDWATATLDHTRFFALTGPHDASCTTCHTGGDLAKYTCLTCHVHQQDDLVREHLEEGIRNIDNCVACHRSTHTDDGEGGDDD